MNKHSDSFFYKKFIPGVLYTLLIAVIVLCFVSLVFEARINEGGDAYVYVPENVRAAFHYTDIKMFDCAWCHRTKKLNRHHIIPQSADISLKDEPTNIVVLCRDCHFVIGHRCNWKHFNPDVMEIITKYTNDIPSSTYLLEYKQ